MCGPGSTRCGHPWPHGPMTAQVFSGRAATKRRIASRYPSSHPPTMSTGAVIACGSTPTDPCNQYSSRRWCESHVPIDRLDRLEPFEPPLAPALADDVRIGGRDEEQVCPGRPELHVVPEHVAAHVVDVVAVPVVGRARADHRGERGRPQRGDLQRVEATPRQAAQPDAAVAPRLRGEPRDHRDSVLELGREVLVAEQAIGVAAARDRDPHVRDACLSECLAV